MNEGPAINPVYVVLLAVIIVAILVYLIFRVVRAQRGQAPAPREAVPVTLLPKTSLGRWSLGLVVAFIVLFAVAVVPLYGEWGMDDEGLVNPPLTIVLAITLVSTAVAALVTGFIGAVKRKERSVLVFFGMLVAFWFGIVGAVGEFFI